MLTTSQEVNNRRETPIFCFDSVRRMEKRGLSTKLKEYMDELKSDDDPYGRRARLRLFHFNILPNTWLRERYIEEYNDIHKYEFEVIGENELAKLIENIGWRHFLKALEWYCVKRYKILISSGSLKYGSNQLKQLITKIGSIPKWLK